jgi:hypothetical protein
MTPIMTSWLLNTNKTIYYLLICTVTIAITYAINNILYTDDLYYSSLGEQYTMEQIQSAFNWGNTWRFVGYFFVPIITITRILYTSFCFQLGNLYQEKNWAFKDLFNISLKADIIIVLNQVIGFYYYAISGDYNTIEELGVNFSSVLKIIEKNHIPAWLVFAYNSINIFEFLYIFTLVVLIHKSLKFSIMRSMLFVLFTYCIGNYFYIIIMTFLYLYIN